MLLKQHIHQISLGKVKLKHRESLLVKETFNMNLLSNCKILMIAHRSPYIAAIMGLNPVQAWKFFQDLFSQLLLKLST